MCQVSYVKYIMRIFFFSHSFVSHDLKGVAEMGREVGAGVISGFNYMDLSGDCVPELLVFRSDKGGVIDMWRWQVCVCVCVRYLCLCSFIWAEEEEGDRGGKNIL